MELGIYQIWISSWPGVQMYVLCVTAVFVEGIMPVAQTAV